MQIMKDLKIVFKHKRAPCIKWLKVAPEGGLFFYVLEPLSRCQAQYITAEFKLWKIRM